MIHKLSNSTADREMDAWKQQEILNYERKRERMYWKGRAIVFTIATLNILSAITSLLIDFRLFSFIVTIALSIALYAGVSWVRYLFIIGLGLGVLINLSVIKEFGNMPVVVILVVIAIIIFEVVCCWLLIANESVSEFLYSQKNG